MATEEGYCRFACDRAATAHRDGKVPIVYMQRNDKAAAEWIEDVEYVDGNGVKMRMTLCPACAEKYRSVLETWRRDIVEFANEGR